MATEEQRTPVTQHLHAIAGAGRYRRTSTEAGRAPCGHGNLFLFFFVLRDDLRMGPHERMRLVQLAEKLRFSASWDNGNRDHGRMRRESSLVVTRLKQKVASI